MVRNIYVMPLCFETSIKYQVYTLQPKVVFHIETSRLFFRAKQMAGFYMKYNSALKLVNASL